MPASGALDMFSMGSGGTLTPVAGSPFAGAAGYVAFSPSDGQLATSSSVPDRARDQVSVYSVSASGTPTNVKSSPAGSANGASELSYSPAGNLLAAANGSNNTVPVFSTGFSTPARGSKPKLSNSGPVSTSFSGSAVVVSSGITVSCPARGATCRSTVNAHARVPATLARAGRGRTKKLLLGRATVVTKAGAQTTIGFRPNRKGLRALKRLHRLRITIAVKSRHKSKRASTRKTATTRLRKKHAKK